MIALAKGDSYRGQKSRAAQLLEISALLLLGPTGTGPSRRPRGGIEDMRNRRLLAAAFDS